MKNQFGILRKLRFYLWATISVSIYWLAMNILMYQKYISKWAVFANIFVVICRINVSNYGLWSRRSNWSYFYTEYHYVLLIALQIIVFLNLSLGWQFHLDLFLIKIYSRSNTNVIWWWIHRNSQWWYNYPCLWLISLFFSGKFPFFLTFYGKYFINY